MHQVRNRLLVCLGCCTVMRSERSQPTRNVAANQPRDSLSCSQVCQTLVSTGTKAVYLNPTDALHGDIGIVGHDDVVVIVSKSGATDELLRLVPYARVRAAALHTN